MHPFSSIVVFVLASVQRLSLNDTSLDHFAARMAPIAQTWGVAFENLYFVLGKRGRTRHFNKRLRCVREGDERVLSLYALNKQTELLSCDRGGRLSNSTIKTLVFENCSGMNLHVGMTCRAQEALRLFHRSQYFNGTTWVLLVTDTMFLRPLAVNTMLSTSILLASSVKPIALVVSDKGIGFSKSSLFRKCDHELRPMFPWALPMIMNKAAALELVPLIESRGLSQLHATWGGPAGAVLGAAIWLHSIATYYISPKNTHQNPINRATLRNKFAENEKYSKIYNCVMLLKVTNQHMHIPNGTDSKSCSQWTLFHYFNMSEEVKLARQQHDFAVQSGAMMSPLLGRSIDLGKIASEQIKKSKLTMSKKVLVKRFFSRSGPALNSAGTFNLSNCVADFT